MEGRIRGTLTRRDIPQSAISASAGCESCSHLFVSMCEIAPECTQTSPIHIARSLPMNKSKQRAFYLPTASLVEGKSDSRRGKRSFTPSFIISDTPQLKLLLMLPQQQPPPGRQRCARTPQGGSKAPLAGEHQVDETRMVMMADLVL